MATRAGAPEFRDFYTRRLVYVHNQSLVESRCVLCGAFIRGSATESLLADEQEHLRHCPRHAGPVLVRPK